MTIFAKILSIIFDFLKCSTRLLAISALNTIYPALFSHGVRYDISCKPDSKSNPLEAVRVEMELVKVHALKRQLNS